MKIISFNVNFRATKESQKIGIQNLIDTYHPDYLCLQEYIGDIEVEKLIEAKGYNLITFEYYASTKRHKMHLMIAYKNTMFEHRIWSTSIVDYRPGSLEVKGIVGAKFSSGDKEIIIVNLHLPIWYTAGRKANRLVSFLQEVSQVTNAEIFICGDFNMFTGKATKTLIKKLSKLGFNSYAGGEGTQKASYPLKVLKKHPSLDWIFTNLKMEDYDLAGRVLKEVETSDHWPILLEVTGRNEL